MSINMLNKHVLLTGAPGVGKTTLIKKVCSKLKENDKHCEGFFTEEVRTGRERIGFDIVTLSEQRGNLARASIPSSRTTPKVGKYSVDVESFEALALPCFNCCAASILVLDEIGKMELFSKTFLEEVKKAFSRTDIRILATIPVSKQLSFVNELRDRKDCLLIEVSRENRNNLEKRIVDCLLEK
ncbi:cancer-related nucleoside-triphosphatase isoform X2 [Parasteatoda tepidariorum]|nr:cancer-related nucleoside-triphosphatase [Parasteatoda tepidariorum]